MKALGISSSALSHAPTLKSRDWVRSTALLHSNSNYPRPWLLCRFVSSGNFRFLFFFTTQQHPIDAHLPVCITTISTTPMDGHYPGNRCKTICRSFEGGYTLLCDSFLWFFRGYMHYPVDIDCNIATDAHASDVIL